MATLRPHDHTAERDLRYKKEKAGKDSLPFGEHGKKKFWLRLRF